MELKIGISVHVIILILNYFIPVLYDYTVTWFIAGVYAALILIGVLPRSIYIRYKRKQRALFSRVFNKNKSKI